MQFSRPWALRRQLAYGAFFASILILIFVWVYFSYFYQAPNCFDNELNGDESATDCGGSCVRICAFETIDPNVKWARSFKVTNGLYNAVAYVENVNRVASTRELPYTFSLYDDAGLIAERSGSTILPPNSAYPVFEARIETGLRIPTRTFLELGMSDLWQPSELGSEQFSLVERTLEGTDVKPRLSAVVRNNDLEEAKNVEVVATIFDANKNALTSSRTFVENFAARSETEVVFTWLEPIAKTIRSCEIPTDTVVAIDLSGSMNSDGDTPPQPLTAVKEAAASFVSRVGVNDQVGVVTFATEGTVALPLTSDKTTASNLINSLVIAPEEEVGSTNTGEALEKAGAELFSDRHNDEARKVLVLLTDGLATAPDEDPEEFALEVANKARDLEVEVYVIGLGENVNMDFVRQIATTPEYAYQALSRDDVDTIYHTITSSICEDGPAVIDIIAKTDAGFIPLR